MLTKLKYADIIYTLYRYLQKKGVGVILGLFFSKKSCPVCGGKLGFLSFGLADGEKICSGCEKLLRGRYDLVRRGAAFYDTLGDIGVFRAKKIIDEMKQQQREDIAALGDSCEAIASVFGTFTVRELEDEEGGRLSALCGKPVALCFCEYGCIKQGDRVCVIGTDGEKQTAVLELIPCTGAYPFETELTAGIHKTECRENTNAWMVLDFDDGAVAKGDRIVKNPQFKMLRGGTFVPHDD